MPSNLPQSFYNQVNLGNQKATQSNYSYEINLNAVNKSLNGNSSATGSGFGRGQSQDYDNTAKNIYMSKG